MLFRGKSKENLINVEPQTSTFSRLQRAERAKKVHYFPGKYVSSTLRQLSLKVFRYLDKYFLGSILLLSFSRCFWEKDRYFLHFLKVNCHLDKLTRLGGKNCKVSENWFGGVFWCNWILILSQNLAT